MDISALLIVITDDSPVTERKPNTLSSTVGFDGRALFQFLLVHICVTTE